MRGNYQKRLELLEARVGQTIDEAAIWAQRAWANRVAHMRLAAQAADEDPDLIEYPAYQGSWVHDPEAERAIGAARGLIADALRSHEVNSTPSLLQAEDKERTSLEDRDRPEPKEPKEYKDIDQARPVEPEPLAPEPPRTLNGRRRHPWAMQIARHPVISNQACRPVLLPLKCYTCATFSPLSKSGQMAGFAPVLAHSL